jgi:hypothetical protein
MAYSAVVDSVLRIILVEMGSQICIVLISWNSSWTKFKVTERSLTESASQALQKLTNDLDRVHGLPQCTLDRSIDRQGRNKRCASHTV